MMSFDQYYVIVCVYLISVSTHPLLARKRKFTPVLESVCSLP